LPSERWKQVEALFEAAQQRPADQRAEFLRQACPDDPDLCAEVASLLKAAESRDPLLDGSPLSSIAERPPALKPGDKLGNFEIVAIIGRGGMGEVYCARDMRLKREVAIKTLPSGFAADRDRIARIEREARAASALNHPNIVSVYDIGQEDGVSFIVSELVDGETLARVIQRGPLPLRKLIEVGTQICDGLGFALNSLSASPLSAMKRRGEVRWKRVLAAGVATVVAFAAAAYFWITRPITPRVGQIVQITHDGESKQNLTTDGTRLYYTDDSFGVEVFQVSASGGEPVKIPPLAGMFIEDISLDRSEFLLTQSSLSPGANPLWAAPVLGGAPRRLGDLTNTGGAAWSPQGDRIVCAIGKEIWTARSDGSESRKLDDRSLNIYT
jgi:hypothetical protein